MNHATLFRHFLDCYSRKDIASISEMLSESVCLRDWNVSVRGREAVESATVQNFRDAETIDVEVLHLHESETSVAGELRIVVNQNIELFVVDVIEFDSGSKVKAIRSYKGRND